MTLMRTTNRRNYNYLMLQLRKQKDSGATTLDLSDETIIAALDEARQVLKEGYSHLTGLERSRAEKDVRLAEWAINIATTTDRSSASQTSPLSAESRKQLVLSGPAPAQVLQTLDSPGLVTNQLCSVKVTSEQLSRPKPRVIPPFTRRHFEKLFGNEVTLPSRDIDAESYALACEFVNRRLWGRCYDRYIFLNGTGLHALLNSGFNENGTDEENAAMAFLYWDDCEAFNSKRDDQIANAR